MREIKFRGLHKISGKEIWVYGNLTHDGYEHKSYYISQPHTSYNVRGETVGQFTGLTDKNGKEVYEGDIVKTEYGVGYDTGMYPSYKRGTQRKTIDVIKWSNERFSFPVIVPPLDTNFVQEFEIIGNIYENPELLSSPEQGENE